MANRLTIKGQVTIPKEVRDFLHLTNGDSAVEFVISPDGSVSLRKAETEVSAPSTDRSRSKTGVSASMCLVFCQESASERCSRWLKNNCLILCNF